MKFTVHLIPPPRLRPPSTTATAEYLTPPSQGIAAAHPYKPLKTVSFPIDSKLPFSQLWKVSAQRLREAFEKDQLAGTYFSHIQDLEGGTLFMSDTIGSLYPEHGPATERQVFMYMQDVGHGDREDTIPAGSDLRPKDFKKRRLADLSEAEQVSVKRRRLEVERYGTTVDELDPDTPVVSREGTDDVEEEGRAGYEEPAASGQVDADGFKIPLRPIKSVRRPRPSAVRTSPAVLVHSSQELPTPDSVERHPGDDIPNPTPPSAQRAPESSAIQDVVASSQGSRNAFAVLGKERGGSSCQKGTKKIEWTPAQDDILRQGYAEKWSAQRISDALGGGRSKSAVRGRKKLLDGRGKLATGTSNKGRQALDLSSSQLSSSLPVGSGSDAPQSSVPVASQSSAPQSSPCATAANVREQSPQAKPAQKRREMSPLQRPIAWVQLSPPPQPLREPPAPVVEPETVFEPEHIAETEDVPEIEHFPEAEPVTHPQPVLEPSVDTAIEPDTEGSNHLLDELATEQQSNGQTVTPPDSVPCATSAKKLRVSRGSLSAAARLRESRNRASSTFTKPRARKPTLPEVHQATLTSEDKSQAQPNPSHTAKATQAKATTPEVVKETVNPQQTANVGQSRARKPKTTRKKVVVSDSPEVAATLEEPDTPEMVEARKAAERSEMFDNGSAPLVPDNPEILRAEPHNHGLDQAIPEITLPEPRITPNLYKNRTDKQRWKEAIAKAKGNRTRAKHIFAVELNCEDMLQATAAEDEKEIERLKAQRRRRERELAASKGLPLPRRRAPTPLLDLPISQAPAEDVDDEVVREDDWSTDEEERLRKAREEDWEEYNEDAGVIYSDSEFYTDVEAEIVGPRVEEVSGTPLVGDEEQTPPPPAPVTASATGNVRAKPEKKAPPPATETSETSKKQKKKRRKSRTRDASSSRRASSVAAPPASSKKAPPKRRSAPKRKLADPPKQRLTREEAVAAHLAECKRKEALYLHNDDDDDDDDDDSSVSS